MTEIPSLDTHYEVALDDDEPDSRAPVYVDITTREHDKRPIVPASLRRGNLKATARHHAGRTAHRTGYHGARLPRYLLLGGFWAIVGVFRLLDRQLRWWWVMEQHSLRQGAATGDDAMAWLSLHREALRVRTWRGICLLAELVGLAVAVPLLVFVTPWWVGALVAALVMVPLARIGRPVDRPIVTPAVVTARWRKLTADIVLRAYYAASLGHADKPGQQVTFGGPMARDGEGSRVLVDLPYGKGFGDAVKAREAIASGLDVAVSQVFLTRDKSSHRRHMLWVADRDPLAIPAGRTPLLDCKPRDIWQPAPLGPDERGQLVNLLLMWVSVLIGAQPRRGKTFTARLLALYAALDPFVKITVIDGKNSPDWKMFRLVAHRIIMGTKPNPFSPDPVTEAIDALREIQAHIEQVNAFLSKLPASECPEGKVTPELARRYPQLRVWMLVMEEFQVYYELDEQDTNKEIAGLLSFIMAVGPSAGVILISSSQKPSGIGAGDVQRLFNRYRDNHAVRIALKCGNRNVSEAVLGTEAYGEGYDASALPNGAEYRGVALVYGAGDHTPTVRCHFADQQDAERIVTAARRHRELAGTLTGHAIGEDMTRPSRDVLADVLRVWSFTPGRTGLHWQQLAELLAGNMPESYAGETAGSVSELVRAEGAPSVDVKVDGQVLKGVRLRDVKAAAQRRAITRG